jgi:DNA polymerase V
MLLDIQPDTVQQTELDLEPEQPGRAADKGELMGALDQLNRRYGRGTVLLASTGLAGERKPWAMKQERRTPQYTTRWEDMPVVHA